MKQVFVTPFLGRLISPLLMLFLITGCGGTDSSDDNTPDNSGGNNSQLQKTTSEAELLEHIRTALLKRYGVMNKALNGFQVAGLRSS